MKQSKNKKNCDIINKEGTGWFYSDVVKDHFFHPRNLLLKNPKRGEFDAVGVEGSMACGDIMKMWLKIEPKTQRIKDVKWRTFGCASAIAATSMYSAMLMEKGGRTIKQALKIKPQDVIKRLGGLPNRKIHCSVLADLAFKKAIENYYGRQKERKNKNQEN